MFKSENEFPPIYLYQHASMKQQELKKLEESLVQKYGTVEAEFGIHRCVNGFKLAIWILSLSGLVVIYGLMIYLKGSELATSPLAFIPLLFVGIPLFLFCNPWQKDWKGYLFDNNLVINNNGNVIDVRYSEISDLAAHEIRANGVVLHYSVSISTKEQTFLLPPMQQNTLTLIQKKMR